MITGKFLSFKPRSMKYTYFNRIHAAGVTKTISLN